jgi:hypothetical protein
VLIYSSLLWQATSRVNKKTPADRAAKLLALNQLPRYRCCAARCCGRLTLLSALHARTNYLYGSRDQKHKVIVHLLELKLCYKGLHQVRRTPCRLWLLSVCLLLTAADCCICS